MPHTDVAAAETPIHETPRDCNRAPCNRHDHCGTRTALHRDYITTSNTRERDHGRDPAHGQCNSRIKPGPRATDMASLSDNSDIPVTDTPVSSASGITIGARIAVGRNTQPRYPLAARKRGYEGQAIIRARIGPSGNVLRN